MPFCAYVCPYTYVNALVKTRFNKLKKNRLFSKHPCRHGDDRNLTAEMSNLLSLV